jgi:multidrug efflux pump subunit AcrA (membrane-fusion protein)
MTPWRRRWIVAGTVLVAVAVLLAGVARSWPAGREPVPTARVVRGKLKLDVHATGELRAARSLSLTAPPVGGSLRLVHLSDTGTAVKSGDLVVEFDPAEQQYQLEQSRSELAQAEQEIVKMRADTEVQAAQDQVDLLTARFDVRRADLDAAAGEELVGAIEAHKRRLAVEEARRRLDQLEEDVKSRAETTRASLAVVEEKRTKARLATERAQQVIDSLTVRAPLDGLVVVKENRDASGGFFFSGMALPEYHAGDTVSPGRPVVDVFDASRLEIRAKVNEQERANVTAGQAAAVRADALPGRDMVARVANLAALATRGGGFFESAGPVRQFDAILRLERPDARLKPGTSVRVVVSGSELRHALHVPRQAIFEKRGKPVVYVKSGGGFEAREVTITHRTEARVVIEGIAEGSEVALVNPEEQKSVRPPAGPAIATAGGAQ